MEHKNKKYNYIKYKIIYIYIICLELVNHGTSLLVKIDCQSLVQ